MRRILLALPIALALASAGVGAPLADTPAGSLRVFVARAEPSSDFKGDVGLGIPVTVEADSAVAFGVVYEVRINHRLGIESGISVVPFDFDETALGLTGELGDATAIPVMFGLDVHVLGDDAKVDLYAGPVVAYTFWSNLDSSTLAGGGQAEIDEDFGFGGVVGLDVPFGRSGWQLNLGLRYLTMSAEDPSLEIDVDPLFVEAGLGYRF